jgi:phenylpyruvate tautomerase PptA (4-oxalocrotonate tautomerase family)
MPLIRVELGEHRVTDESTPKIIKALTDTIIDVLGDESLRETTWVVVEAKDPKKWGVAGAPWA